MFGGGLMIAVVVGQTMVRATINLLMMPTEKAKVLLGKFILDIQRFLRCGLLECSTCICLVSRKTHQQFFYVVLTIREVIL